MVHAHLLVAGRALSELHRGCCWGQLPSPDRLQQSHDRVINNGGLQACGWS